MNKEKFLETLRKKLSILEESEIEDILTEYEGYIEEKIATGSTEEEAVKSMGNVNELAKDLLSAYKIKTESEKNSDTFNNLIDSFMNIADRIISVFAHKSFQEIVRFIFELVFIFIIIAICKIPFEIIESIGRNIFSTFGNGTYRVLYGIWNFILEFAYLIFAILLFIKIFESRYLNEEYESVLKSNREAKKENNISNENKETKVVKEKKEYKKHEHESLGLFDALSQICIWFIKFILLFFLFGVACYIIGMACALGVSVYLMIKGVLYFGIYIILIALFVLGVVAFLFLFNFIFDHKNKIGALLITSLISFVFLGIGTGICALEFAETTVIYTTEENKQTEEFLVDMNETIVLSNVINYHGEVKIDESLNNQIKVVYKYNDKYMKITPNVYVSRENKFEVLHAGYRVSEFYYSKEFFEHLIEDLKYKTIVATSYGDVEIEVYVSSKTKEQLDKNERKYKYDNYYKDRDLEDICEELYDKDLKLPDYCKSYDFDSDM